MLHIFTSHDFGRKNFVFAGGINITRRHAVSRPPIKQAGFSKTKPCSSVSPMPRWPFVFREPCSRG